jgi:type VI secretion system (T6SS) effector Hcp
MMQRIAALELRKLGIAGALLAGACVLFCGAANAQAQTTAYVQIVTSHGAIAGAAKDPGHEGWIPCREASTPSVSEITATNAAMAASAPAKKEAMPAARGTAVAASAPRDMATGQASGKRGWEPVRIMKEVDASSPKLFQLAASGEKIPEVDIALYHSESGKMVPAATYKLTDAIISSVQKMSSGGDRPMESVTFTFQKIEITH